MRRVLLATLLALSAASAGYWTGRGHPTVPMTASSNVVEFERRPTIPGAAALDQDRALPVPRATLAAVAQDWGIEGRLDCRVVAP